MQLKLKMRVEVDFRLVKFSCRFVVTYISTPSSSSVAGFYFAILPGKYHGLLHNTIEKANIYIFI
jgi:hypothetical protein